MRKRLLLWLVRLYPRWWRARYRAEFADMLIMLVDNRSRPFLPLALDIIAGALDAQLTRSPDMPRSIDPALRRGGYDGLVVAVFLAVEVLLTNVVFPQGPDGGPEYAIKELAVYTILFVLLAMIGVRGARLTVARYAGARARAGAMAGFVIGIAVLAMFLAVDNLFFSTISQQHDKIAAFAASGGSSMRTFVNVSLLEGAPILVPFLTAVGAILGHAASRVDSARRSARV
jgi:hypothetical protein